ncbi:MAG TPA: type IV pilus modification protein PilV [Burkholderiaceae bacterium]|nr:type IV pilus modification protein PilV [Burkholderiaceae bacterium]
MRWTRSRGFTMLEIMVALLVLALGIICGTAMQLAALRTRHQSALLTQSLHLANSLAERMRANSITPPLPDAANPYLTFNYDALAEPSPAPPSPLCYALDDRCDRSQLAQFDLYDIKQQVRASLPAGRALVCRDAALWQGGRLRWGCTGGAGAPLVVKVGWRGKRPDGTAARDADGEFAPGVAVAVGAMP